MYCRTQLISCNLSVLRKSSRLQREEKASSGKPQAGSVYFKKTGGFLSLTYLNKLLLTQQMFQMRWRGHLPPRGAASTYRDEKWRRKRKRKIVLCGVALESPDTN